jgi:hypothetical protein
MGSGFLAPPVIMSSRLYYLAYFNVLYWGAFDVIVYRLMLQRRVMDSRQNVSQIS